MFSLRRWSVSWFFKGREVTHMLLYYNILVAPKCQYAYTYCTGFPKKKPPVSQNSKIFLIYEVIIIKVK